MYEQLIQLSRQVASDIATVLPYPFQPKEGSMRIGLNRKVRALFFAGALAAASGSVAACTGQTTSSAQCAYVVGDGQSGRDRNIKQIVYPGKDTGDLTNEVAQFVPCGPRNFIINDGSVKNANNQQVGDRFTPTQVWTKDGPNKPRKQINIWTSTFWTLNQSDAAMRSFYNLCFKYGCYTDNAEKAGDANFSTPGWNGMLGENFGGAIDQSAVQVLAADFDSDITNDPTQWVELGNKLSVEFMKQIRARTGNSQDLFCGSGNSGWKDPNKPGEGEFTCTNVRITVEKVEATDASNRQIDTQAAALEQRIANAKKLYGEQWAYWLGVQDAIDKCKQAPQVHCVINIGGNNVSVPVAPAAGQ